MKDKFEEDIQNLNENQSNGYLRKDVKPSYVNFRNEVKSVILETDANKNHYSTANNVHNNKTAQEKCTSVQHQNKDKSKEDTQYFNINQPNINKWKDY